MPSSSQTFVAYMENVCGSRSESGIPMVLMDGIGLNITLLSMLMSLLRALLYSSFKLSLGICDGLGCNVIYIFQQTSSDHFLSVCSIKIVSQLFLDDKTHCIRLCELKL